MADIYPALARKTYHIPTHLLDDLSSRFIINVPEEERVDLIRVCFQIELAHWFYLDFYCEEDTKLPKCTIKEFIRIIFKHIPFLQKYILQVDSVIAEWREYKKAVPTFGAIMLNQDLQNVLLVQSYAEKASWGFPKGKVNKDEQPHHCAIREVWEEIGFDIANYISKEDFLEHHFNDQLIRLYIITGIPENVEFQPKTRKEIKSIEWFPVSLLPSGRKDRVSKTSLGTNNFFMVMPFVKPLKKWIASKLNSGISEKIDYSFDNLSETEKQVLKQQQLFSQYSKNELAKYLDTEENAFSEPRINRPLHSKSNYSPPPRMIRQRNLKQNVEVDKKKVCNSPRKEDKGKQSKKSCEEYLSPFQGQKGNSSISKKDQFYRTSVTWAKFSLDKEALIATFNINLRLRQGVTK